MRSNSSGSVSIFTILSGIFKIKKSYDDYKDIDKNDQAKLCYCATAQRLYAFEDWLIELADMFEISKIRSKDIRATKRRFNNIRR